MAEFFRFPARGISFARGRCVPGGSRSCRPQNDPHRDRATERRTRGRSFPRGRDSRWRASLLEGAPLRPGASTLAQIAGVPILPCVILGSDRLYSKRQWLPLRRTPIWIAFGNPISHFPELQKSHARERIESELASAFKNLYTELRENFG